MEAQSGFGAPQSQQNLFDLGVQSLFRASFAVTDPILSDLSEI